MTIDHKIALDLSVYAWRQRHGDIEVFGTWFGPRNQPCLALIPAIRRAGSRFTPQVIRMENAWIYDEHVGDPRAAAEEAYRIADDLALNKYDPYVLFGITSAIRGHLGDLLHIPPHPSELKRVVAEAVVTERETGRQTYSEMRD